MPRIPLYNQGLGPSVRSAVGQLSPRASEGAFTAPGRAVADFASNAQQIAFNFGMAEKQAEADRQALEMERIVSETMDSFNRESTATTVAEFQSGAQEQKDLIRKQSLDPLRSSLTPRQFEAVARKFDTTFSSKIAEGSRVAHAKNMAIRKSSFDEGMDRLEERARGLSKDSDAYKSVMEEFYLLHDKAISYGINPKYTKSGFEKNVDQSNFAIALEAVGEVPGIEALRSQTEQNKGLSGAEYTRRQNQLDARENEILAEKTEEIFDALVSDGDLPNLTDAEQEAYVTAIRNKEDIELDGNTYKTSELKSGNRANLIARIQGANKLSQSKEQDARFLAFQRKVQQMDLAALNAVENDVKNQTGPFSAMENLQEQNQYLSIINSRKRNIASVAIPKLEREQDYIIDQIILNNGVASEEVANKTTEVIEELYLLEQFGKADELMSRISGVQAASRKFSLVRFESPKERVDALNDAYNRWKSAKDPNENARLKVEYETLDKQLREADKQIKQDFVNYHRTNTQTTVSPEELIAIQERMGIAPADIRVTSNADLDAFRARFDGVDTYFEKAEIGRQFLESFGIHQNRVLGHMVKTGKLSLVENLVIANPNAANQKAIFDGNAAEIVSSYTKSISKNDRDAVNEAVTELMGNYTSSILGGVTVDSVVGGGVTRQRTNHALAMNEIAANTANYLLITGQAKDPEEAAQRAVDYVINESYDFEEVNETAVRFDKGAFQYASEMAEVMGFSIKDNLEYLQQIIEPPPAPFGMTQEEYNKKYFDDLMSDFSWRTTTDNTGVYLVDQLGNLVRRKVPDAGPQLLVSPYISAKFSDIAPLGEALKNIRDRKHPNYESSLSGQKKAVIEQFKTNRFF